MLRQLPSSDQLLFLLRDKKDRYWEKVKKERMLGLFHEVSKRVPAYKDFLKKNGIKHELIKTYEDLQKVPPTNKNNYIKKYSEHELCWNGTLNRPLVYTATSGSTGEPAYFVRGKELDWQYSVLVEEFLGKGEHKKKKPILVIICFGMGLWIGGLITYKAFEIAANRSGYPVSLITPGLDKKEIFAILKKISGQYDQTILAGYPPFLKDVVDEAELNGVNIKSLNVRLFFAAEAITEEYRNYVVRKAHIRNKYLDTMSIYGSADIGAMATETTTSILIKNFALKNKRLFHKLFTPVNKTPTLAQYNPYFINFDSLGDEIVLTGDSAIPLVRYAIGDNGGVFSFNRANEICREFSLDIRDKAREKGIVEYIHELPFVYIYERKDFSTTFYGIIMYPEWFKKALYQKPIDQFLTGKFTLVTKYDKNQNQFLEINIEMKKDKKETTELYKQTEKLVMHALSKSSSEFRTLYGNIKERAKPKIVFWPAEDPLHFKVGIKQKWVKK